MGLLLLVAVCPQGVQGQTLVQTREAPDTPFASFFGSSSAVMADVTGDDVPEILAQKPLLNRIGWLGGRLEPSTIYVLDGSSDTVVRTDSTGPMDRGDPISSIGDLDHDQTGDYLVSRQGAVYLNSGADGSNISGVVGRSAAPFPDVTGNGIPGVMVGEDKAAVNGQRGAGRVVIFNFTRPDTVEFVRRDTVQALESPNPEADGAFGQSVATLGDVNDDGLVEVAVGAPWESNREGQVHVFSTDGTHRYTVVSPNAESGGNFGYTVESAGDFDGDGASDLVVGAYRENGRAGRVYVVSGADGTIHQTLEPSAPESGAEFGTRIFASDRTPGNAVVVGAPLETVNGTEGAGHVYIFDGNTGSLHGDVVSPSPATMAQFGASVSGGNLAGDGRLHVVAGEPVGGDNLSGALYQFETSLGLVTAPTGLTVTSTDGQQADLNWSSSDFSDIDGYNVYRSTESFSETDGATKVNESLLSETQFTDDGLETGTTYAYRVTTVSTEGTESGLSTEARVTTGNLEATASETVGGDGEVSFAGTGTTLTFSGVSGSGEVTVSLYGGEPDGDDGITNENVSNERVTVAAGGDLNFDSTTVALAVSSFSGIEDPSNVAIYKREAVGGGAFDSLKTTIGDNNTPDDVSDDTLYTTTESFSEFALGSDMEPLPVEIAAFDAGVDGNEVRLTWTTASERNNAGFRIQRRAGEQESAWTTVGSVEGAGTTSEARSYRFRDADLPYEADAVSYRLKQVDTDGSAHYSGEVTVQRGVSEVQLLGTYPNPARQQATVRYALPETQDSGSSPGRRVTVRLYDVLGRAVRTVENEPKEGRHEQVLDVSDLSSGVYFLRLKANGAVRTQKLTVVQ